MKKILNIILVVVSLFAFSGCNEIESTLDTSKKAEVVAYPFEIDDNTFEQSVSTVISLSPAVTEAIYELGFGDKIVGRSSYCDYPVAISSKADVGSSANPDISTILTIKPELLISQSPIASKDVIKLTDAGIKVIILKNPSNYSELKDNYVEIAMLFVGAVDAKQTAEITLTPLSDSLQNIQPEGTFAYIMTDDLAVSTGETLSSEFLSYFSTNVAVDYKNYFITPEELTAKNPDILFISNSINKDALVSTLPKITAHAKIITIDNIAFERPTVRTLSALVNSIKEQLNTNVDLESSIDTSTTESSTTE